MKRAKSEMSDGSILLLDTMCNAFGGIIFISFLLVVLINSTSAITTKTVGGSVPQAIESELDRDELANRLASLNRAAAAQSEIPGMLVSKELLDNAARLKNEQTRHARLVHEKSATVGELNNSQLEINQLHIASEADRQALETQRKKERLLQTKIAEESQKKSRTATAPKMTRAGGLRPLNYFLQHGKLFGPAMLEGKPNVHDFIFTPTGEGIVVEPIAERGLQIADNGKNIRDIEEKLSPVDPTLNSVHLNIWEDSYRDFDSMRVAFEDRGLTYAVVPWEPGDKLVITHEAQERWEQK
jgi:hypothetical protein